MPTIKLSLQPDFVSGLAKTRKPLLPIVELIWNGLDADAREVSVRFIRNALTGIDSIVVEDDGEGLPYDQAMTAFGNLGGSPKLGVHRTARERRLMHGRYGKGRFRALGLGEAVEWKTRYRDNGRVCEYAITGTKSNPMQFDVTEPEPAKAERPGTIVTITGLLKNFRLTGDKAEHEIAEYFALYLREYEYADVSIKYDGHVIDPCSLIAYSKEYPIVCSSEDDTNPKTVNATLTVIEWTHEVERVLCLCDEDGFTLEEVSPGIHARGLNFTAYLKSPVLRELADENALVVGELHPILKPLLDETKRCLREYGRMRGAQVSASTLQSWKDRGLYPYSGQPKTLAERTERDVFDLLAASLTEFFPAEFR